MTNAYLESLIYLFNDYNELFLVLEDKIQLMETNKLLQRTKIASWYCLTITNIIEIINKQTNVSDLLCHFVVLKVQVYFHLVLDQGIAGSSG